MNRSVLLGSVLLFSLVACGNRTVRSDKGAAAVESVPEVEYTGPVRPAIGPGAVEMLFQAPARAGTDLGTIRVTCSHGCRYSLASAAMMLKARAVGASGVHHLTEVSGNVAD